MSNYQANIIIKNPATPTGPAQNGSAPGVWRMNEVSYWLKQGIWPTQGIIAGDTYFNYVSMLLSTTSLGNANNNLFVDSSGAFNPISRNGNTTQGSVTPYSANWSNYFDGTGDWITTPNVSAFDLSSSSVDFTIEAWVYNSSSTFSGIIGARQNGTGTGWCLYIHSNNTLYMGSVIVGNSYADRQMNTTVIPKNTWTHIALVKTSAGYTAYVNGVGGTLLALTGGLDYQSTRPVIVGALGSEGEYPFNGYISNVRVVKGTAVYTSNFTPPTVPLTAITNTSYLTCQSNRFRDASANNFTITRNGDTRVTDFAPFSLGSPGITYNQSDVTNWSGYFDGNGDWLSIPNNSAFNLSNGDFTLECWVYNNSVSTNYGYMGLWDTGYILYREGSTYRFYYYAPGFSNITASVSAVIGSWTHLAVVRSGSTITFYVNGTSAGTASVGTTAIGFPSQPFIIGANGNNGSPVYSLDGYMSNVRVVKGTAVYTGNFTPPTSPLTAISGTSLLTLQNAAFTDNSTNNFVITPTGNVTVTGNSPFNPVGHWSLYGPSTAGATVPQTTATDLGSGSFTVECWVNLENYSNYGIVTKRRTDTALTGSWAMAVNASGYLQFLGVGWATTYTSSSTIPLNRWVHLAVTRSGTSLAMYIDGTRVGTATDSYDYTCSTYMIIKLWGNASGNYPSGTALSDGMNGSISNLRIVQGTAVYNPSSPTITVPTSPLTAISGTSFLSLQNSSIKDNSTNNVSISLYNSAAALRPFNPFYTSTTASNGGSMYFDGSGDWLNTPSTFTLSSTADFTLEFWLYPIAAFSSNRGLVSCGGARFGLITEAGSIYFLSNSTEFDTNTNPIPGAWNHIAMTRTSGTIRIFLNGVQIGTRSSNTDSFTSQQLYIGSDQANEIIPQSYMSDVRWAYTSFYTSNFTPPTAPLTPSANTTLLLNGMNAGIYDATAINDMETVSGAQVVTTVSKFGGSSVYFNGTGGFLDIPAASSKDSAFGTGDFTVEMWLYFNSVSGSPTIITFNNFGSGDGFFLNVESSAIGIRADGGTPIRANTTVTTGVWYHVAVTRSSGTLRLFQNGVNVGSTTWTTNCTAGLLRIGQPKDTTGATYALSGYMDELRITKGYARYTSNFTPPTEAFPTY